MSLNRSLAKLSFLLALGLATPACSILSLGGPSTVAQGKYYASGNQQYDEFFLELYRLQVRLAEAPGELSKARTDLARSAAVDANRPSAELADKLHTELQKLAAKNIRVKIEITSPEPPDAKATSAKLTTSGNPSSENRALFTTIESALTTLVKLRAEMQLAEPRLGELRLLATQLEGQIDQTFDLGGTSKRREVKKNLEDAVKVIALMLERAKAVEAQSGELSSLVAEKAGTDDGTVGLSPSPPVAAPSEPVPVAEPKPEPARPAAPRPQARPTPPAPEKPKEAPEKPKEAPKAAPKPAEFEP